MSASKKLEDLSVTRLASEGLHSCPDDERAEIARLLWGEYSQGLLGYVRPRLSEFLRTQTSPESVVQMAFAEFFGRLQHGGIELKDRDGLLSLLVTLAGRRLIDKFREARAQKRSPSGDVVASSDNAALETGQPIREQKPVPRGYREDMDSNALRQSPTEDSEFKLPALEGLLLEADVETRMVVGEIFDGLDDCAQSVFLLWIQQFTMNEIARKLDKEPRYVKLVVKNIRQHWSQLLKEV